jgi:hypothetical protein
VILVSKFHSPNLSCGISDAVLVEAIFARRSHTAGGFGNPLRVPINNRAVAPMVEQRSPKPRVVGSSPACPALLSKEA